MRAIRRRRREDPEKGLAFETREPDLEAAQAGGDPELTGASSPQLFSPAIRWRGDGD